MGVVRCHFCHKLVTAENWEEHRAVHLALKADGQHTDYTSLPEPLRYQGSLEGVPMWYTHTVCGITTGMPEFIVRTYLVEPDFYADITFCHGCNCHVPHIECYWRETQECLADYFQRLQLEFKAAQQMKQMHTMVAKPISGNEAVEYQPPKDIWEVIKDFLCYIFRIPR